MSGRLGDVTLPLHRLSPGNGLTFVAASFEAFLTVTIQSEFNAKA
jgi:hypothetical protein